jgi:carboxymethylenebutenolidase
MDGQMVRYGEGEPHSGYLTRLEGGAGPAVLVLHAWWGLNDFFKALCDRLAAEGYVAFAPDLYHGKQAATIDEASHLVETSEQADIQDAVLEAVPFIVEQPGVRPGGIGVIGFSLGAAWAARLSVLRPDLVSAVVLFYGTTKTDFDQANAGFLGHFCVEDDWEPRAGVAALQAALVEAGRPTTIYFYEGVGHWFFEADRPEAYNPEAAQLAWERTLAFLAGQFPASGKPSV